MRCKNSIWQSAVLVIIGTAFSLGVLATDAAGDDNQPGIHVQLGAGLIITANQPGRLPPHIFTVVVAGRDEEPLPFETVCVETPAGEILPLEAGENGEPFLLFQSYRRLSDFEAEHLALGGRYTVIFDRDTAEEDSLVIDYPYTEFYEDFPLIILPEHEDEYVPLQMTARWDPVPQWRDYDGILVELDKGWETGNRLFTSEMLSTRETTLNIEKEYAILETDTKHTLTVRMINEETVEATTQTGTPVQYTVRGFAANQVFFITTPDYYLGNSSADTTCFVHAVLPGTR